MTATTADQTTPAGPPAAALETAAACQAPSLAEMIVEAEKTVRERVRSWPERIGRGRLTLERAAEKLAAMRRIAETLRWLAANEDWIRAEAGRRATEARLRAEAETLTRDEPAVAAVLAAFPGAEITDIQHVEGLSDGND